MTEEIECRDCGKTYHNPVETSIIAMNPPQSNEDFYSDMDQLTSNGWWWDYYDGLHVFCHDCIDWTKEWSEGSGDYGLPKRPYSLYTSRQDGPPGEFLDEES